MAKSDFLKRHTEHTCYGKATSKKVGLGEMDTCAKCGKPFVVTIVWAG